MPKHQAPHSWAKARVTELPASARLSELWDWKGGRRGEHAGDRHRSAAITEQGLATDRPAAEGGHRRVASSRHNTPHPSRCDSGRSRGIPEGN
jgi:hypothetical protein